MMNALIWFASITSSVAVHDIRPLLKSQGFDWPVERRLSKITYVGRIGASKTPYTVHLYNAVNPQSGHGLNFFLIFQGRRLYGIYESLSAHDCMVRIRSVICKTDYPGNRIDFDIMGPPSKIWIDGAIVPMLKPRDFRASPTK